MKKNHFRVCVIYFLLPTFSLFFSTSALTIEQDFLESASLSMPDLLPHEVYVASNGVNDVLPFDEAMLQEYSNLDPGRDSVIYSNSGASKKYKPSNARRNLIGTNRVITELAVLGFPEIWTDSGSLSKKGHQLVKFIKNSYVHGLIASDYNLKYIRKSGLPADEIEVIASKAFVNLTNDILLGRLYPKKADFDWHIKQDDTISANEILSQAVYSSNITELLNNKLPQSSIYGNLSKKLRLYKKTRKGWGVFPSKGPKLRLNSKHKDVKLLRRRLKNSGYLKSRKGGTTFDKKLKKAVIKFQGHHGLNRSGVVSRQTRLALSVSIESRITQLEQSLERFRWMPNFLPSRHIIVNTAGSELNFREDNYTILNMRTVVGQKRKGSDYNTETPSFDKKMKHIIINPEWYVPQSIITKEFLPKIKENLEFFAKNNYQVYDRFGKKSIDPTTIDWKRFAKKTKRIPYQIRQGVGDSNALGRVKFMFPNRYSIYLHDTPSKGLFSHETRSYSHGCVRLARPLDLASKILNKSKKEINGIVISDKKTKIVLDEELPVYIAYITAWSRDNGTVVFYPDTYGFDKRMENNFL